MAQLVNQNKEDDIITQWFKSGMYGILENIFINLPVETLLNCRKVSHTWNEIISYFHLSKNPRIAKLKEDRVNLAWRKKEYLLKKLKLPVTGLIVHHIISDSGTLVIATSVKHESKTKVFIYNLELLNLINMLETNWNITNGIINGLQVIMNDDILVASIQIMNLEMTPSSENLLVISEAPDVNFSFGFYVWDRHDNYAGKANCIKQDHELKGGSTIIHPIGIRVTLSENNVAEILFADEISNPFSRIRNGSSKDSKETISVLSYKTEAGFHNCRFITKDKYLFHGEHKISLFSLSDRHRPIWSINLESLYHHSVAGHSAEYLAIKIYDDRKNHSINVYNMQSGNLVKIFNFPTSTGKTFSILSVQFGGDRLAVLAYIERSVELTVLVGTDVIVLDLKTGGTILKLSKDFPLSYIRACLLKKNYLIVSDSDQIYKFRFGL